MNFRPIKATAQTWFNKDPDTYSLRETEQDKITALLEGRKVTKVDGEHLLLDDGTLIKAIGHDGGCACSAGCYYLTILNGCDNIITRVEYDYRPRDDYNKIVIDPDDPDAPEDDWYGYYRIYVFAEDKRINLMQVEGNDGNGYYGTGFELLVRPA